MNKYQELEERTNRLVTGLVATGLVLLCVLIVAAIMMGQTAPLASVHIVSDAGQLQTITSGEAIYADPFVFFREANGLMGANVRTGQRVLYRLCTLRGVGGGHFKPVGDSFSCPTWMDYDPATRLILTNVNGGVTAYRGAQIPANRARSVQLLYLTESGQVQYRGQANGPATFGGGLTPGFIALVRSNSTKYIAVDIATPPGSHQPLMPQAGPFDGAPTGIPRVDNIDGFRYTISSEAPFDFRHFVLTRHGGTSGIPTATPTAPGPTATRTPTGLAATPVHTARPTRTPVDPPVFTPPPVMTWGPPRTRTVPVALSATRTPTSIAPTATKAPQMTATSAPGAIRTNTPTQGASLTRTSFPTPPIISPISETPGTGGGSSGVKVGLGVGLVVLGAALVFWFQRRKL